MNGCSHSAALQCCQWWVCPPTPTLSHQEVTMFWLQEIKTEKENKVQSKTGTYTVPVNYSQWWNQPLSLCCDWSDWSIEASYWLMLPFTHNPHTVTIGAGTSDSDTTPPVLTVSARLQSIRLISLKTNIALEAWLNAALSWLSAAQPHLTCMQNFRGCSAL